MSAGVRLYRLPSTQLRMNSARAYQERRDRSNGWTTVLASWFRLQQAPITKLFGRVSVSQKSEIKQALYNIIFVITWYIKTLMLYSVLWRMNRLRYMPAQKLFFKSWKMIGNKKQLKYSLGFYYVSWIFHNNSDLATFLCFHFFNYSLCPMRYISFRNNRKQKV